MPPKKRISSEDIVYAGIRVIDKEGIDGFNARGIASELKCSTQPIFSNFVNMDDLREAVYQKAKDIFNKKVEENIMENVSLLVMVLEYTNFANTQKELYNFLFMNNRYDAPTLFNFLDKSNEELVNMVKEITELNDANAKELLNMMTYYVYGMATRLANRKTVLDEEKLKYYVLKGYLGLNRIMRESQGLTDSQEYIDNIKDTIYNYTFSE